MQELVDLLLVLDDREARLGVIDDEGQLALDRVLVERHRHAAERLGGHDRPVERRAVVADDRDLVAAGQAEREKAERDQARFLEVLAPGIGLPDAVFLLANGDLVGDALGVPLHQLREGIFARSAGGQSGVQSSSIGPL